MWRGYGQNGDGISLGFDFDKLPGAPLMRLRDRDNPENNNYQLDTRLIYNKDYPIKCVYTEPNDVSGSAFIPCIIQKKAVTAD